VAETLTILWRPNQKDAWHGIRLAWWGTPRQRIRTVTLFFVLPTILFGWILHSTTSLAVGGTVLAAVLAGVAWGALTVVASGSRLARSIVKAQLRQGDVQRIIVSDQGIDRILDKKSIHHAWTEIVRIEETPRMFMLFGPQGPVTSIEKSGIDSAAELASLRAFLRQRAPGKYLRG